MITLAQQYPEINRLCIIYNVSKICNRDGQLTKLDPQAKIRQLMSDGTFQYWADSNDKFCSPAKPSKADETTFWMYCPEPLN